MLFYIHVNISFKDKTIYDISKNILLTLTKKVMKILIFLFVVAFGDKTHQQEEKHYRFRPGGQKMIILGLFQNCPSNTNDKETRGSSTLNEDIQIQAQVCQESVEHMVSRKNVINKALNEFHQNTDRMTDDLTFPEHPNWSLQDIEYRTLSPICTQEDLDHTALDLLLNKEYYIELDTYNSSKNLWNEQMIYFKSSFSSVHISKTRILAILVFADNEFSNKLTQSLANTQFPIYHLKIGWRRPLPLAESFKKYSYAFSEFFLFDYVYEQEIAIVRWKKANYFAVVFLESGVYMQDALYKRFFSLLQKQSEFCFKHFEVLLQQPLNNAIVTNNQILIEIKSDPTIKLILTFGDPKRQVNFFNEALAQGLRNLTWIFQDVDEKLDFVHGIPLSTKVATYQKNPIILFNYIDEKDFFQMNSSTFMLQKDYSASPSDLNQVEYLCKQKAVSLFNGYVFGVWQETESRSRIWYDFFHQRFRLHVRPVYASKKPFYAMAQRSPNHQVKTQWPFSFKREALNTKYKNANCAAGYEMNVTLKDTFYGQNCMRCSENFYKNVQGNGSCIKCPIYTSSNANRDACFDTYNWNFPNLKQLYVLMALLLNFAGELFCLFAIATLLYKRNTPMIRAMDFKVTLFHIMTLSINFLVMPWLYIERPNKTVCILRPLFVSVLNNLSLAFVIIKSQRLLRIFKAKLTIFSEGELRRYNFYTGTSVFFICAVGQTFLFLPASKITPMAITVRVHKEMIKDVYCNTEEFVNIQLGYSMVLQLFTAFQAFKCRSLPGPFNEAMSIVYSTFVVIVTYSVTFPIYYFLQRIPSRQSNVHFVSLSVTSFFSMLILYGHRLFVVVFKSSKNTKEYIRSQMWTFSSDNT